MTSIPDWVKHCQSCAEHIAPNDSRWADVARLIASQVDELAVIDNEIIDCLYMADMYDAQRLGDRREILLQSYQADLQAQLRALTDEVVK